MENQLQNFVEKFFRNLGAKVNYENDVLEVSEVTNSFEKFFGKNAPYKFVFQYENLKQDYELINKNSYLIKAISSYLENSGQTTLLKINFEMDAKPKIIKNLKFSNSQIQDFIQKKKHNFFFRFTFHTSFQYLTENEKIINDIYIHDGKIINGDLSNYPILDGSKKEVSIPDMKEPYLIAKEQLKKEIRSKTEEVARELEIRLKKEQNRIESHFEAENSEYKEKLDRAQNRLKELLMQEDKEKISKQENLIESIKINIDIDEIIKNKKRALEIEKQKHMLGINNKLFNTTLIYYPLFTYNVIIKNIDTKRIFEVSYDPLIEKMKDLFCENCNKKTNEFLLCSTGHLSCKECHNFCESCNKEYCKKCIKIVCQHCNKKICKECSARCFGCGKVMCKGHTRKDKVTERIYCNNCLKTCARCSNIKDPTSFKQSKKTGGMVCEDCFRNEMRKEVLGNVFGGD